MKQTGNGCWKATPTKQNPLSFNRLAFAWDVVAGKYEGYILIQQGDNAGPHQDKDFKDWCISECERRGWHWEPQAAQMPYVNNLDLAFLSSPYQRGMLLYSRHILIMLLIPTQFFGR
jgi:hypothetical protein